MSIENFYTSIAPQGAQSGQTTAKGGVALNPAGGVTPDSAQGLSFLDFILSRLAEAEQPADDTTSEDSALQSDNPLLDKTPELSISELLADNPEIEQQALDFIEATGLGPDAELSHVLGLNAKALDEALKPIIEGLSIEKVTFIHDEALQESFEDQAALQALFVKGENGEEVLNVFVNLTPEQITALKNIEAGEPISEEFGQDGVLAFIRLVPVGGKDETQDFTTKDVNFDALAIQQDPELQNLITAFLSPYAQGVPKKVATPEIANTNSQQQSPTTPLDQLAARLNAIDVGSGSSDGITMDIEEYEGNLQTLKNVGKDSKAASFDAMLANGAKAPAPSADLPTLQPLPALTAAFGPFEFSAAMIEEYGMSTNNAPSLNLSSVTNLITQSQSASHAHPATQMVAVNIQKMAGKGENRTLSLQLDPPELGRVQVDLKFGSDKSVKALLTIEKPETFMMMQRDAQVLERALQEAGLDTGDGLNFELAEQGFDFDRGNERGGGHDRGGTGAGGEDAPEEIIESTMTWHVDPESGHTRYDILA